MPNVTPIYVVTYNGEQLPGYVQTDDRPVVVRSITDTVIGREGFISNSIGAMQREINLSFLVKSRLGDVSDLLHLEDCKDQWRDALRILTRDPGMKELKIHDTDRYYLAKTDNVNMPLEAGRSRSIVYNVKWTAQPWAYDATALDTDFTGNTTLNIAIGDTRKVSPQFLIPSGVTGFTATDENGKVMTFLRDTVTGAVTVDCGTFEVFKTSNGVNVVSTMQSLNYGLYYNGTDGTYQITITGFAGSGTVTCRLRAKWEL